MSCPIRALSLLLLVLSGCSNFNGIEQRRIGEQLEDMESVVAIRRDSAATIGERARERAKVWLRSNSDPHVVESGDTLRSGDPSVTAFGYRIIRQESPDSVRYSVGQRSFGGYYSGLNARRLVYYMTTGVELDTVSTIAPRPRLTSFVFQFGGEGMLVSCHLERIIMRHLLARIGVGYDFTSFHEPDDRMVVPVGISWISRPDNGIELGLGLSTFFGMESSSNEDRALLFFPIAYRHAPAEGGGTVRVAFTPRYSFRAGKLVVEGPFFGISVGYTF
jgi:hypothetical protein